MTNFVALLLPEAHDRDRGRPRVGGHGRSVDPLSPREGPGLAGCSVASEGRRTSSSGTGVSSPQWALSFHLHSFVVQGDPGSGDGLHYAWSPDQPALKDAPTGGWPMRRSVTRPSCCAAGVANLLRQRGVRGAHVRRAARWDGGPARVQDAIVTGGVAR